ncbi:hypothetical protein BU16DRAFT_67625 [Lophium mytilinum]|uniref:Uncharacterized protein n=1 Tax=Lophium mytilinum TaxID=390894 RepID=A0A6A6QNX6_9PEZI|nr:hypothetical protein BU16DRAFT_67625 [Lophium mytilinum]
MSRFRLPSACATMIRQSSNPVSIAFCFLVPVEVALLVVLRVSSFSFHASVPHVPLAVSVKSLNFISALLAQYLHTFLFPTG